jgi:hypothetical protein
MLVVRYSYLIGKAAFRLRRLVTVHVAPLRCPYHRHVALHWT